MTLIKSISGIRGTIGGTAGEALTPPDIVKYTSAFGTWLRKRAKSRKVVIGRDARLSGPMVKQLVAGALQGCGLHVIDLDLSTTPTVEIAIPEEKAAGGIIITASHNPKEWNALKLLNEKGEFVSAADGQEILQIADKGQFHFVPVNELGGLEIKNHYLEIHIQKILALSLVDTEAIRKRNFKIVVDAVNSSGGIAVPKLLRALGVEQIVELYCEPDGRFPHNPEPLPEHLLEISKMVKKQKADLGIAVDPDVDRLALIMEDGSPFGEEYTLVAVADYVLQHKKGDTVSNLSSTRALRDVAEKRKVKHHSAAVGEVHVVEMMKKVKAVIGGEGNGGIIYPELHYGRDALVGIALFLSHLARSGKTVSMLRAEYPNYYMSKNKIELNPAVDIDRVLLKMQEKYKKYPHATIDGLKIDFDDHWIHLRKSNTEPILRIYTESKNLTTAESIAQRIMKEIGELSKQAQS
ncbi:MAG: phosphoglucosamine mutase [Chitinophagales bacterium]|nr:MAG: phosphoglucosamine mutase [Chitinophagales bacterium]